MRLKSACFGHVILISAKVTNQRSRAHNEGNVPRFIVFSSVTAIESTASSRLYFCLSLLCEKIQHP